MTIQQMGLAFLAGGVGAMMVRLVLHADRHDHVTCAIGAACCALMVTVLVCGLFAALRPL